MATVEDKMTKEIKRMQKELKQVPEKAVKFWKAVTPKDTGNARRKSKVSGHTIHANYEYASYLDNGSSKQNPKGMSKLTTIYLNNLIKKIMGK